MQIDEARRHRNRRTLVRVVGKLHKASTSLVAAEEEIGKIRHFSPACKTTFENIDALRAGIEETQKIISQEVTRIEYEMQEPSAEPPPEKGAYLNDTRTPLQKILNIPISTIPRFIKPKKSVVIPQRLEFHYEPRKYKPRTKKKEGVIPI